MKTTLLTITSCIVLLGCSTGAFAQNIINTIAGTGTAGYSGDNGPATGATLNNPGHICTDAAGNLYIADGLYNNAVRKINAATGVITTVAGTGTLGNSGNGGPATNAMLSQPSAVYVNAAGTIYIADGGNNMIRKVDAATGIISTIAGTGVAAHDGDGGPATDAHIWVPTSITGDAAGNIYFTEYGSSTVRKITSATGIISTFAGTGVSGSTPDGAAATASMLGTPEGICTDGSGNVYFCDVHNYRVKKIDAATGLLSTIAGNGSFGYTGDGGAATAATLFFPHEVCIDNASNLYIADAANNSVRRVTPSGIITTIAGMSSHGYSGDGGPATNAQLWAPGGIAVNAAGAIYISDAGNNVIRKITTPAGADNLAIIPAITMYPNPAAQELFVNGVTYAGSYSISDISGHEQQAGQLQAGSNKIALVNIAPGTYLLKVIDRTGIPVVTTIIKQ